MFKNEQDLIENIHKYKSIELKNGLKGNITGVVTKGSGKNKEKYISVQWVLSIAHTNLNTDSNSQTVIHQTKQPTTELIKPRYFLHLMQLDILKLY